MSVTVALTFDDGPSEWTPPLLDVLAEHDARATFFVIGRHVQGHERTLRRMVGAGHEIGLHGWDHSPLSALDEFEVVEQIDLAREAIFDACGAQPVLWRSPWHLTPEHAAALIDAAGLTVCGADVDVIDMSRDEQRIVADVVERLADGLVIGLHDGIAANGERPGGSREPTVRATARILEHCRSVTASDLLRSVV